VTHSSEELPAVRLREIESADAPFMKELREASLDDEWDGYDDGPDDMLQGSLYGGGAALVELNDGTPVGSVSWIQVPHGPNRKSLAWCIGITVLPSWRGRRIGAAAQRQLSDELFKSSEANRVEAETDVGNVAERRALERAGFREDGVARGSNWRRGDWHDMVVYSRLRSDLDEVERL